MPLIGDPGRPRLYLPDPSRARQFHEAFETFRPVRETRELPAESLDAFFVCQRSWRADVAILGDVYLNHDVLPKVVDAGVGFCPDRAATQVEAEELLVVSESAEHLLIRAEAVRAQVAGDPVGGRETAERVANAARESGAHAALVVALCAAGWAAREIYDHKGALVCLDEAVLVARRHHFDDGLAEALVARAGVHMEFGRTSRARRDITAARVAATNRTRAEVEFAEALLCGFGGNPTAAAVAYRRALRHALPDQRRVQLRALHNLGLVEVRRGRHDVAARLLDEAADLAAALDAPALEAVVIGSQALAASERGDPVVALRRFDDAEAMMTASSVPLGEMLVDKASALLTLRLLDEAATSVARAVQEFSADDGRALMLADALLLQARIDVARGRFDIASASALTAEDLLRRQRRPGWRAHATLLRLRSERLVGADLGPTVERQLDRVEELLSSMGHLPGAVEAGLLGGRVAIERQRPRRARTKLRRVAEIAKGGPILVRLQGRTAAALLAEVDDDRRRLGQICRQGLADLARYRATFASAELRARAASHGRILAELGLRSAVRSGHVESIWSWLERGGAVAFVRTEHDIGETIQPQLSELRQLERDLVAATEQDPGRTNELLRSISQVERRIRHATWVREQTDAQWTLPTVHGLRAVRSALADRVLLQYGILGRHIIGVVVSTGQMRFARLGTVDEIATSQRQLASALRRLAQPRSSASVNTARAGATAELGHLGHTLVTPLLGDVGYGEIIVAAPAELIGIPWGALPRLAGTAVRVTPSATAWYVTSKRTPASARVVAVAGPNLAGANEEIERVARCHHDDVVQLVGPAASCRNVQQTAAGAALVHLACHGHLRTDSPTFSSLQLEDGPLTVHDLEQLATPAHHWVLAACDLGAAGRLVGSELEGVLAALLFGGAAGVVAAVVSVPDVASLGYMEDLHHALARGESLASAVHHARISRDMTDPAEFVTSVAYTCYGGG